MTSAKILPGITLTRMNESHFSCLRLICATSGFKSLTMLQLTDEGKVEKKKKKKKKKKAVNVQSRAYNVYRQLSNKAMVYKFTIFSIHYIFDTTKGLNEICRLSRRRELSSSA